MRKTKEYEKFQDLADKLLSVPHSEIKAKLDKEKKDKVQRKQRKKDSTHGK